MYEAQLLKVEVMAIEKVSLNLRYLRKDTKIYSVYVIYLFFLVHRKFRLE